MLFQGKKVKVTILYNSTSAEYEVPHHQSLKCLKNIFLKNHPKVPKTITFASEDFEKIYTDKEDKVYISEIAGNNQQEIFLNAVIPIEIQREEEEKLKMCHTCNCKKKIISNYCVDCKFFTCTFCSSRHEKLNHKMIKIDMNDLSDCIKLYTISLNGEIANKVLDIKAKAEKFQNFNYEKIRRWKDSIISSLDKIEQIFVDYNSYKKVIYKDFEERIKKTSEIATNVNKKIKKITDEIIMNESAIDLPCVEKYFNMLQKSYEEIKQINIVSNSDSLKDNICNVICYIDVVETSVKNSLDDIENVQNKFQKFFDLVQDNFDIERSILCKSIKMNGNRKNKNKNVLSPLSTMNLKLLERLDPDEPESLTNREQRIFKDRSQNNLRRKEEKVFLKKMHFGRINILPKIEFNSFLKSSK